LRQFGLLLFLSGVGLKAGSGLIQALRSNGGYIFISGMTITLVSILTPLLLARYWKKMEMIRISGLISGVQTQPAVLAFSGKMTGSDLPNMSYAAVYPLSMILKIIIVQFLL
jgi:putative transport protein